MNAGRRSAHPRFCSYGTGRIATTVGRAKRVVSLVEQYSDPDFATLLGHQGQLLFENGMGRTNFRLLGENVNEWNGRKWEDSNENLDYIYERDGVVYGVEVKNALGRIKEEELTSKTAICEHLGVVPFFAVRWMPQNWIQRTAKVHKGFVLMLKLQLYPVSHANFARTIRENSACRSMRRRGTTRKRSSASSKFTKNV